MRMNDWQDNRVFWDEALKTIQHTISDQEYVMWFQQIQYASSDESTFTISVPSSFYRDQVKQRYLPLLESTINNLTGREMQLNFEIRQGEHQKPVVQRQQTPEPTEDPDPVTTAPGLNPDYQFDSFVVGDNNRFAANAAMAVARNPGTTYNPCLIYGGVGLGKTHLLHSIGSAAWMQNKKAKVVYVTAEEFTNEFILSIRENRTHTFKTKYRNADVLLIDDIHFLQKKNETQEELFHTFNALFDARKQMVFTSDRLLSDIKDVADRLRNRFSRGLTVDLQPPQMETAIAILKNKAAIRGVSVSDEVISLICQKVTTNVRDLEAALTKIIAYAELVNKDVSLEVAQQQLKDFFSSPLQNNITIDIIQRIVADYFNLSSSELKGKKRTRQIAFPRQMAMYISREITESSMTDVGLEFGGRDHTTVMHACQRITSRMRSDPTIDDVIQTLVRRIKEEGSKAS